VARFFNEPLSLLKTAEVFSLAPGFSPVAADIMSDKPFQRLFFFLPAVIPRRATTANHFSLWHLDFRLLFHVSLSHPQILPA